MNWIIVAIALLGIWINIKQRWQCFICWLISNAWWFWHNLSIGEYAQAILFAVFFFLSIWGLCQWRRKKVEDAFKCGYRECVNDTITNFCNRLINIYNVKHGDKVKVNWIKDEAERILKSVQKLVQSND